MDVAMVREMRSQGAIAKAIRIGQASVYWALEASRLAEKS
jgi:hypothetical protein